MFETTQQFRIRHNLSTAVLAAVIAAGPITAAANIPAGDDEPVELGRDAVIIVDSGDRPGQAPVRHPGRGAVPAVAPDAANGSGDGDLRPLP